MLPAKFFLLDNPLPNTRMESCQALQGFLLNQNPDYVARIAVVSPAGSLLTLAPALSAHRYLEPIRSYTMQVNPHEGYVDYHSWALVV